MDDNGKARRAKWARYMREYRERKRKLESDAQATKRRATKAQYDQEYYRMIRKGEAGAENGKFWNGKDHLRLRKQIHDQYINVITVIDSEEEDDTLDKKQYKKACRVSAQKKKAALLTREPLDETSTKNPAPTQYTKEKISNGSTTYALHTVFINSNIKIEPPVDDGSKVELPSNNLPLADMKEELIEVECDPFAGVSDSVGGAGPSPFSSSVRGSDYLELPLTQTEVLSRMHIVKPHLDLLDRRRKQKETEITRISNPQLQKQYRKQLRSIMKELADKQQEYDDLLDYFNRYDS